MPQKAQVAELGLFFSKLPLFSQVSLHMNNEKYSDSTDIERILKSENTTNFTIDVECIHPALLPDSLKEKLYALSENRRQMHEMTSITAKEENTYEVPDHKKAINPSIGISKRTFEMSLCYEGARWYGDYELEGYQVNCDSFTNLILPDSAMLSLECPVSSIYEYFAYVIDTIAERFPEISVDGGLDCAGGFLYGCTYSSYLYEYECLTLETHSDSPESIKRLMEKLVATHTAFPCVRKPVKYTSNYFTAENEVTLLNGNYPKPETMSFGAYIHFLTREASPMLKDKMKCAVFFLTEKDTDWKNFTQLTAYPNNGQWFAELYVKQHDRQKIEKRLDSAGIEYR
jgi:hypothetical protein